MSKDFDSVAKSWKRIERWVDANNTTKKVTFPDGASDAEIRRAEDVMGVHLPEDVRRSYNRHNGSNEARIFEQGFVLPLGGVDPANEGMTVAGLWSAMRSIGEQMENETTEIKGPIQSGWWRIGWVPLTENWEGEFICVDLDPPKNGTTGQVFFHWAHIREYLAESWGALLAQTANEFEAGLFNITDQGYIQRVRNNEH